MALALGHIGKAALTHGFLCQRHGHIVVGESGGAVAVEIARELVEHDDFGQAPVQAVAPAVEFGLSSLRQQSGKAAADGLVEVVAFLEPEGLVFFGEPEIQNGLRGHGVFPGKMFFRLPESSGSLFTWREA